MAENFGIWREVQKVPGTKKFEWKRGCTSRVGLLGGREWRTVADIRAFKSKLLIEKKYRVTRC